MYKIQTLNTISETGLQHFPREYYQVSADIQAPDAILVRSHDLHKDTIPSTVLAIGRAGVGINTIPVDALTKRGIPVFNTPGANANAVRELVIAGMLMASRNICQAWYYVNQLKAPDDKFESEIEKNKKQFVGFELMGKTLGVVGLGSVGVKVANAALSLGMHVVGYDPTISVSRAWELSSNVKQARTLEELLIESDFVSFHVPLTDETRHMMNASRLKLMKQGAVILNFSREGIIDQAALLDVLNNKKILSYVTDFPSPPLSQRPDVICLPHLGASTFEAEENCAVMIVKQLRQFLEQGSIVNAVNFPTMELPNLSGGTRLAIVNANIPNMVAQISTVLATAGLNIASLYNKSLGEIAYTVIDISDKVKPEVLDGIRGIAGVIQVRQLVEKAHG